MTPPNLHPDDMPDPKSGLYDFTSETQKKSKVSSKHKLHNDAERADAEAKLLSDNLDALRLGELQKAIKTLKALQAQRNSATQKAARWDGKLLDEMGERLAEIDRRESRVYARAVEVWSSEMLLTLCALRQRLPELLEKEFGLVAVEDAQVIVRGGWGAQ